MRKQLFILFVIAVGSASFISLQKKATQNHQVIIDPTIVQSMVLLRTKNQDSQLLPWNAQDGMVSLQQKYDQALSEQENKLWQKAQKQFGISRHEYEKQMHTERYRFTNQTAQRSKNLSEKTIDRAEKIMKTCGFDPKTIAIIAESEATTSPAATTHKALYIYEPAFKKIPLEALNYILAHEMMHIKHQDALGRSILKRMLSSTKHLTQEQEQFINRFSRFQETRADIHAITTHKDFAYGGQVYFDLLIAKKSNCVTTVHPKNEQRLQLCTLVTNTWNLL